MVRNGSPGRRYIAINVYGHLKGALEREYPQHQRPKEIETQPASATGLNVEMILEGSGSQTVGPGPAASETPGIVVRNANFQALPQTHIIRKSGGGDRKSEF